MSPSKLNGIYKNNNNSRDGGGESEHFGKVKWKGMQN
jgi:hypothetical protein